MVTLREVAEQANVSITTVSNVLHGNTRRVSPETIERVQSILQQNRYVSRMGLRMLKGASSRMVGVVIISDKFYENTLLGDYFYGQVLGALEPSIRNAGYYTMLYASSNVEDIYRTAATWNLDGLIAVSFSCKEYKKLRQLTGKPVVGIDLYNMSGDDVYNIGLEDEEGAYEMTRYLIQSGYDNIFFFANSDWGIDHQRWLGYRRALSEAGMVCRRSNFVIISTLREERKQVYRELFRHITPQTAWFFAADNYAIEAMSFLQEQHYKIPGDIAVVGFDDEPHSATSYPGLTTVHQNVGRKGAAAFEVLHQLLNGEPVAEKQIRLPVSLTIRQSTRWKMD